MSRRPEDGGESAPPSDVSPNPTAEATTRAESRSGCATPVGVHDPATSRHDSWHRMMRWLMHQKGVAMRTTLALDDELLAEAQRLTGMKEKSLLVREALRALIERESAR